MLTLLLSAQSLGLDRYFSQWTALPIILLILGIGLLVVEMLTPGLGFPGLFGGVCLIASVIVQAKTLTDALISIAAIIVVLFIAAVIIFKSFSSGRLSKTDIVLNDTINENSTSLAEESTKELIGQQGITISELRPVGIGEFNGKRLDIIAVGNFIAKGEQVQIIAVEDLQIKVKPIINAE